MFDWLIGHIDEQVADFAGSCPSGSFFAFEGNIRGLLAVIFVCLICGAMGALVVGNRMAFFSDALAHCAFAGFAVGIAVVVFLLQDTDPSLFRERVTVVMVIFGVLIGLLIAYVREQSGLTNDTVIGVFYAAAVGLGAIFTHLVSGSITGTALLNIETFIFGDPVLTDTGQLIALGVLAVAVLGSMWWMHNYLVLSRASPTLALSRRVPVRFCHYLLIVMLGVMVNLCLLVVGALLINGLLIVPAAAAANLSRNLRQMFWYSVVLAMASGLGGYFLSWEISVRRSPGVGISGTVVVLAVVLFIVSMLVGRLVRERGMPAEPEEESD